MFIVYNDVWPASTAVIKNPLILIALLTILLILTAEQPHNKWPVAIAQRSQAQELTTHPINIRTTSKYHLIQEKAKCFKSSIEREVELAQRERN